MIRNNLGVMKFCQNKPKEALIEFQACERLHHLMVAASVPAFPLIPDTSTAELSVEAVSYRWPNGQQGVNLSNRGIPGPGLWMLVGSNGSGKSTVCRLIA